MTKYYLIKDKLTGRISIQECKLSYYDFESMYGKPSDNLGRSGFAEAWSDFINGEITQQE